MVIKELGETLRVAVSLEMREKKIDRNGDSVYIHESHP